MKNVIFTPTHDHPPKLMWCYSERYHTIWCACRIKIIYSISWRIFANMIIPLEDSTSKYRHDVKLKKFGSLLSTSTNTKVEVVKWKESRDKDSLIKSGVSHIVYSVNDDIIIKNINQKDIPKEIDIWTLTGETRESSPYKCSSYLLVYCPNQHSNDNKPNLEQIFRIIQNKFQTKLTKIRKKYKKLD